MSDDLEREKINLETAAIAWSDLERFFAQGLAIYVANDVDLVDAALAMSKDDSSRVKEWLDSGKVQPVPDDVAKAWVDTNAEVWAVVIRPWVLVQNLTQ